jgi:hypothetical protein
MMKSFEDKKSRRGSLAIILGNANKRYFLVNLVLFMSLNNFLNRKDKMTEKEAMLGIIL